MRLREVHGMVQVMEAEGETTYDMLKKALAKLMEREAIDPANVECVIYGHAMQSHPGGMMFLDRLKGQFGLQEVSSFTVTDLNCATTILAFQMAHERLKGSPKRQAILLFAEKMYTPLMRKIGDMTILADGAAACLVQKEAEGNEILQIAQFVDGKLSQVGEGDADAMRWFQVSYFLGIKKVLTQTLKLLGSSKDEVRMICAHNVNRDTWDYAARSLGLPLESIYTDNIAKLGHVNGCDLLINLEDLLEAGTLTKGDLYVLISVGLGGAYGCIALRR